MASILLVLGVLGVVVAGVTVWPLVAAAGEQSRLRPATATVVEQRPCGQRTEGDRIEVRVDGKTRTGTFDGCGHVEGRELEVMIPAEASDGFVATPAASAGTELDDLVLRANLVLATLAAVAGGGYGILLGAKR